MTIERSKGGNDKAGEGIRIGKRLADIGVKLSETVSFPELETVRTTEARRRVREPVRSRVWEFCRMMTTTQPGSGLRCLDHVPHSFLPWGNRLTARKIKEEACP